MHFVYLLLSKPRRAHGSPTPAIEVSHRIFSSLSLEWSGRRFLAKNCSETVDLDCSCFAFHGKEGSSFLSISYRSVKQNRDALSAETQACSFRRIEFARDQRSKWWDEKYMAVLISVRAFWWLSSYLVTTILKNYVIDGHSWRWGIGRKSW